MAIRENGTVNPVEQVPAPDKYPERSLSFVGRHKAGGINLWAVPATPDYTIACYEGALRAFAVLGLETPEGVPDRALWLGDIFGRIATDQVCNSSACA